MSISEFLKSRPKSQDAKEWAKMEQEIKRKARRPVSLEEVQEQYKMRMKILEKIEEINKQ